MNVKALTLAGISAAVAVVTFVALNLIAPITHATEEHAKGVTADQVFAASVAEPGASAPVSAEPAAEPAAESAAATSEPASPPPAMEVAMVTDEPPAAPAEEPSPAPASEPAAPATGGGACSTGIVDPKAKPVVVMASGLPGDAPAGESVAAAPAPEPAAESAPPPAAPEPESAPAPAAAPEVAYAPEPVAAPAPKPKAKSKPKMPKSAPAEAKTAWWPAKTSGKLNLTYAGEASFTKAIVLLFDGAFDNGDSANQNVKVATKDGKAIEGKWLVATGNRQMLLFNVDPGLYKVEVGSGMTDKGGRAISAASSGLVFIP